MLDNGLLGQFRDVSCSAASLLARGCNGGRTWQKEEGCREYLLATTHPAPLHRVPSFFIPICTGGCRSWPAFVSGKSPSNSSFCLHDVSRPGFFSAVSFDFPMARVISPIGPPGVVQSWNVKPELLPITVFFFFFFVIVDINSMHRASRF